jgi:hypothetical protein
MQPSRRQTLRLLGTAALPLLAGCSAFETDGTDEDGAAQSPAEPVFEVRLQGPDTDRRLFDEMDVATVGTIEERNGGAQLPITLTDDATAAVTEAFQEADVAESPESFEVVHRFEGETVGRYSIAPSLADTIATGEWDGSMVLQVESREQGIEVRTALVEAGATETAS